MNPTPKQILLGRTANEGAALQQKLNALNVAVVCIPLISVDALPLPSPSSIHSSTALVLVTSKNTVAPYAALRGSLPPHQLAVVGNHTAAACQAEGITPDHVGTGKGALPLLIQLAETISLKGKQILYPCSNLVTDELVQAAAAYGATMQQLPVYRTSRPAALTAAQLRGFDVAVFYSSSGAIHFYELVSPMEAASMTAVAMGAQTATTLKRLGVVRVVESARPDVDALYQAIESAL